jgi:DNA-binding SARP family transcriptional activator
VRIYVLGHVTLEAGDVIVHERALPGNQPRVALAMLAVEHRHPISRDQIADELWPNRLPASWETALRAVVSKIRATLSAAGLPQDAIRNAFGCYQLRLNGGWLDLDAAADALHVAQAQLARGEAPRAAANATVTSMICSRPFLPGIYGPWTLRQRDRIRNMHVLAQQCLAEARAELGDYARSAQAAETALSLDPYREAAYRQLIRSRALAGDRIGAASVYRRYREVIETELGIEPTPDTVAAFHDAIGADHHAGR